MLRDESQDDLRAIDDLHVAVLMLPLKLHIGGIDMRMIVAELQESLNPAARVLRSLSIVAMR